MSIIKEKKKVFALLSMNSLKRKYLELDNKVDGKNTTPQLPLEVINKIEGYLSKHSYLIFRQICGGFRLRYLDHQILNGTFKYKFWRPIYLNPPFTQPPLDFSQTIVSAFHKSLSLNDQVVWERIYEDMMKKPTLYSKWLTMYFAEFGLVDKLKIVLALPKNNPSISCNYALRQATQNGHTSIVQMLLNHKRLKLSKKLKSPVNPYHKTLPNFLDCIYSAFEEGHHKIVELIIEDGRLDVLSLYSTASKNGQVDLLRLLLSKCKMVIPLNMKIECIRRLFKSQHRVETFSILIADERFNLVSCYNEALLHACIFNVPEIAEIVVKSKKTNPACSKNNYFMTACLRGQSSLAKALLIDERIDPTAENNRCIRKACEKNWTSMAQVLLSDKRVNAGVCKNFCIRAASSKNFPEIVRMLLLNEKVDPTVMDNCCIRTACRNGFLETVRLLLADSRVDTTDCIQEASENGHTEIVRLLLSETSINPCSDSNFSTRVALENGHTEILDLLRKARKARHRSKMVVIE